MVSASARRSRFSRVLIATLFAITFAAACKGPTAPTPPPPPPPPPPPVVANPPTITCPSPVMTSTTSAAGKVVTFETPAAVDGQPPVTVACSPMSGSTFPIGTTMVECTVRDSLDRSNACTFAVTVTKTPELRFTKFLAFGDSITAGEVTVPVTGVFPQSSGFPNFKLQILTAASYPTVLRELMQGRYTSQSASIVVANEGVPGEMALASATFTRFSQALSSHQPDVLLLMHGYNDVSNPSVITATVNAVDNMAAEARNRGVGRVFMINMAPGKPGGRNSRPPSTSLAFNERLLKAANGEGAVYVDIHSALLPAVDANIGVDGLHPTEIGYRRIAETIFAAIQATLEVP